MEINVFHGWRRLRSSQPRRTSNIQPSRSNTARRRRSELRYDAEQEDKVDKTNQAIP
jgi:hypothetical protein